MENAERIDELHHHQTGPAAGLSLSDGSYASRSVPADWFLDPADPDAARRLEAGTSLEDQATAFLAEHTVDDSDEIQTPDLESAGATVTALHPDTAAPGRRSGGHAEAPQPNVWIGLPGLADPLDVDGELAWQVDALCAQTDPEAFFPEKGGSTRDAKKVCSACTVRSECLEYALGNDERFGIWGGLSERERRRLRKRSV
jgi:WhiB family transcriptional regulator, redox-sensing transcriptional regulator